jgi:hypothetical protein
MTQLQKSEAYFLHKAQMTGDGLQDILAVWQQMPQGEFLEQFERTRLFQCKHISRKAFEQGFKNTFGVAYDKVHQEAA